MDAMQIEFTPEFIDYYEKNIKKYHAVDFIPGTAERLHMFSEQFFEFSGLLNYADSVINETEAGADVHAEAAKLLADLAIQAQQLEKLAQECEIGMRIIAGMLKPIADIAEAADDETS